MTPYARCSTRLNRLRAAELEAWRRVICDTCNGQGVGPKMVCYGGPPYEIIDDCQDCGGMGYFNRPDPRAVGKAAHDRMAVVAGNAVSHVKDLIIDAVEDQAARWGWKDLADRVKAALGASRAMGTARHRPRRTQARG